MQIRILGSSALNPNSHNESATKMKNENGFLFFVTANHLTKKEMRTT